MAHISMQQYQANARAIYVFWRSKGLTHQQACGMLANADAECSCNPSLVGDHGQAAGLHQWHADRADVMLKGCGIDVRKQTDIQSQLEAAFWELEHVEHKAFAALKAAETAYDAGAAVCRFYERAGAPGQTDKRGKGAEAWEQRMAPV